MKKIQFALIAFFGLAFLNACIKDDFDAPDTTCLDQGTNITNIISIADVKQNYNDQFIEDDVYIKAQVTASDRTGNIYKTFYVSDGTGALGISVDATNMYTLYPEGRFVYIKLKGLYYLNNSIGYGKDGSFTVRIPVIFMEDYIIRGACETPMEPLAVDLQSISGVEPGTLIKLSGVEFEDGLDGITYANAVTQQSENRYIQDCNNNSIIVRNSGYADFAGELLPAGNGTLIGVYAPYGNTPQILIRDTSDVDMKGIRCDGSNPNQNIILNKNFEDGSVTSGGWQSITTVGNFNWSTNGQGNGQQGALYAQISNYSSGNSASEAWLVSPVIDLSAETNPVFSFMNAYNYSGDPLQVLISTDFDGQDVEAATWSSLNPTLSSGGWDWVTSTTDLSLYQTGPFYIAFKYTGTSSSGSTWEVDAIKIVAD
ncbi:MAG: DUF5689 domain-containing protein [Chitinophagales bacterium]|nr:choice-of-anchor J domain-containing protein [Chitinophagales bacterium]